MLAFHPFLQLSTLSQPSLIMSEPSSLRVNELNEFTDAKLDDKYIYSPQYDLFLCNIKPVLMKRSTQHLQDRQGKIIIAANKIIPYIETLCKRFTNIPFNASGASDYTANKIRDIIPFIEKFISEWQGPIISKDYKKKFDDPEQRIKMKANQLFSNAEKFNHNSRNWCDQSSWKVEGEFFRMNIEEIKLYIQICDAQISGVANAQRQCIVNCLWCYVRLELLIAKITFQRTNGKPLIRNKTLKDYVPLHRALDIIEFVKEFKSIEKQLKENKNKNGTKRVKISEIFAKRLIKHCKDLLNKAEGELHESFRVHTPIILQSSPQPYYNHSIDNISMTSNSPSTPTIDYSGHHSGEYYSNINRWGPYSYYNLPNTYYHYPPNRNEYITVPPNTYYNRPNTMVTNGIINNENITTRFDNSDGFINSVFNDGYTNYYGNYNPNIIGDGVQEVNLDGAPHLSEQINREMAVDAVNNLQ